MVFWLQNRGDQKNPSISFHLPELYEISQLLQTKCVPHWQVIKQGRGWKPITFYPNFGLSQDFIVI